MDLKAAATLARQHLAEAFDAPQRMRLETWTYDDHLMVWSLTFGFQLADDAGEARIQKIVRVSEANQSVLSVIGA